MKFTLAQLRKLKMPYTCSETLDLSEDLNGFENILKSEPANVTYTLRERGEETYLVEFKYSIKLVLEDSVSLDEVPYELGEELEEVYTTDESNEDATIIEGITLDTHEAILTSILSLKPMNITVHEFIDENDEFEEEESDGINPAFASLKDLL